MNETEIGPYTAGEIPPPLVVTFKRSDGTPIDWSAGGPWVAKFEYRPFGGVVVTRSATAPVANDGKVTYIWVVGDFTLSGDFEAELWVGNGGANRYASQRFVYRVSPALAIPSI